MKPAQDQLATTIAEALQQANTQLGCAKLNLERAFIMLDSYTGNRDIKTATRNSLDQVCSIRKNVDRYIARAIQAIADDLLTLANAKNVPLTVEPDDTDTFTPVSHQTPVSELSNNAVRPVRCAYCGGHGRIAHAGFDDQSTFPIVECDSCEQSILVTPADANDDYCFATWNNAQTYIQRERIEEATWPTTSEEGNS